MSRYAAADTFVDTDGQVVAFEPTYEGWFGDARYPPRYGRAALENSALLAFELFVYWYDPTANSVDWQFPDIGTKLSTRSAIRFDDNLHRTNWLFHPFAGSMHYGFSRVNGLGIPASFAAAAASSALYEAVFEWRELASVNDFIVTPIAGMAVGEFFHQLGDYLNSEQSRPRTLDEVVGTAAFGRKLAAMTLGFPRKIHNVADGRDTPPLVADDSLGLSSAYWHAFRLRAGQDLVTNDAGRHGTLLVAEAEAALVAMPGFLRPGTFDTWFHNGNFTAFRARVSFSNRVRDLLVDFDTHLFGHYYQHIEAKPGGRYGMASEIAARTGLHYVDRWLLGRRDHYAMVHLLAPTAVLRVARGRAQFELSGDLSPDFAAVRSLAYAGWVDQFGEEGTKSSLLNDSYYNAWGVSAGARAVAGAYGTSLALEGRYGHYESIDGLERDKDDVTREPHMKDRIVELGAEASYEPEGTLLSMSLEVAHIARRSDMPPVRHQRSDQRYGLRIGMLF